MEALKYQHPNVVVINARWVTAQYDTEEAAVDSGSGALHLSLDFMRLSGVKIRAALDIASKSDTQSSMDYILPLYKYHSREDLTKNDFNFSYIYEQHALKGSCIQLEAHEIELYPFTIEKVPPAAYDYSGISAVYAEKMIELCEANGINVLLLSLPVTGWDQAQHAAVQNFADTHSVSYLDMNMSDLIEKNQIDPKTDFADGNHENIFGSYKTSSFLASFLAENYTFDRNYSDDVAESFDRSYAVFMGYYHTFQSQFALESTTQLEPYLSSLDDSDDYVIIISAKDEFSSGLTGGQKNALRSLGLETDYYADIFRYSYIALIDSGSVVYEECSPDQLEVEYAVSADVSFTAKSAGLNSGNLSSVLFGDDEYSLNERGLNIVVFSKKLGWVIDSINFDTFAGTDGFRGDSL